MIRKRLTVQFAAAALACFANLAWAGYGDDRALIEDLQARYLFAFDFGDPEGYAGTFAPDGILDFGQGEVKGREAIAKFIADGRKRTEEARAKIDAALELNPIAPDEYLWTAGGIAFFLYRYEEALSYLLKMKDTSPANKLIAASAAMLGHADVTQEFVRRHLEVYPDFRVDRWTATIPMMGKQDVDHYVGALRVAGFHLE